MPEYQKVSYTSYTTSKIFSRLQGQLPAPTWMSNCDKRLPACIEKLIIQSWMAGQTTVLSHSFSTDTDKIQ